MRILLIFAHPLETSFVAALHAQIVEELRARGHDVDDLDLYEEGFNPALSRQARVDYLDTTKNLAEVRPYVERLRAADALVLVFPIWFDGLPAIMKGFFERVFLPGVGFKIDENGVFSPILLNIKRLSSVCTYGSSRTGRIDAPRSFVEQHLGALIAPGGRLEYLALYDVDTTTPQRRAEFLTEVTQAFGAW
jgi:NAD(P)H dehydrogenase (quinone)